MTNKIALINYIKNGAPWYIADLPGHDGLVKSRTCPNSDWGYTDDRTKAIPLTPYWQRRFVAHCKRISNYGYSLYEV